MTQKITTESHECQVSAIERMLQCILTKICIQAMQKPPEGGSRLSFIAEGTIDVARGSVVCFVRVTTTGFIDTFVNPRQHISDTRT